MAVSHFDLAQIYLEASHFDSCAYYLQQAKDFWHKKQSRFRLFLINNAALKVYLEQENPEAASAIYLENRNRLSSPDLPQQARAEFYSLRLEYFKQSGQTDSLLLYRSKDG